MEISEKDIQTALKANDYNFDSLIGIFAELDINDIRRALQRIYFRFVNTLAESNDSFSDEEAADIFILEDLITAIEEMTEDVDKRIFAVTAK